jgi:AcrR family transcriptional regulator
MTIEEATIRLPLSRERIIEAAVAFGDEHGIEALSMRRLGRALGVEAMSLYNHVDGKDDILDGMVDALFAEIGVPVPDGDDWKSAVRLTATRAKDVFAAHTWSVPLMTSRGLNGASAFALMDATLGLFLDVGYPIDLVHHAWHVISSHVMGYAFQESSSTWGKDVEHDHDKVEALIREYADRFPHVARLVPHLMDCSHDEEFQFGLDIILTGIEARLGR